MSCTTKTAPVEVAVRTLIKEIVHRYKARRRERLAAKKCEPCRLRHEELPS